MHQVEFNRLVISILIFCVSVTAAFILLNRSKSIFPSLKPAWLRRNLVTYLIGFCFFLAFTPIFPDLRFLVENFGFGKGLLICAVAVFFNLLVPYNLVLFITENRRFSKVPFVRQQVLIFLSIVISTILVNLPLNYYASHGTTRNFKFSALYTFYVSGFGSLLYLFLRHSDLERKRKLYEKELQVARLSELKTKAELDTLQAKINPHFLYNALNSIAELTLTDGSKARKMTLGLADLFRYSINYSNSNFSTVAEELEMARLYLEIEKIRFEDQLSFSLHAEANVRQRQLPRFLLQPMVENAVKHGLKNISSLTEITVEIRQEEGELKIDVYDNGPGFPENLVPGYGLKSIFDKLELLYPGNFTVDLQNYPSKHISIRLKTPAHV